MNLLIDMGNSRVKWRLRQSNLQLAAGGAEYAEGWQWLVEISAVHQVEHVWVASVAGTEREGSLNAALAELQIPAARYAKPAPDAGGVRCGYADCQTLGVDRWLAMVAARSLIDGAVVVVDSGSAITADVVTDAGDHLGGWIGPGVHLMRRSLAGKSGVLAAALAKPYCASCAPGVTTQSAIDSAITVMGCGLIDAALRRAGNCTLILSGGDASVWQEFYPEARLEAELVFIGLEHYFAAP
ncbi:type III pantothenate kinase [Gilvimarinus sp. SDUM040013]|uniref:Type III pantothenate kinase n=1 Tax=Gilvimarinus gilvus TaxID=3058038 RepID=A0ABU4S2K7_9GAMM|nr:type III pantothenate kinase [Gilvimarinus sp. SDUM040013]MDO3385512.1 type III pantothenate kinase [Gilvimarinus sp. SDUM040013]MDX6851410.1 type III pantothenate kinase [Gilvimarinus sp. SDUM040013]